MSVLQSECASEKNSYSAVFLVRPSSSCLFFSSDFPAFKSACQKLDERKKESLGRLDLINTLRLISFVCMLSYVRSANVELTFWIDSSFLQMRTIHLGMEMNHSSSNA